MKKILLSLMVLGVTACSDNAKQAQPSNQTPPATTENASKPTYRVVSEVSNYAPFIMRDENKKISGFEYDLLNAIAAKQGFTLTFEPHTWEGIFDTLDSNRADIISAGLSITEERQQKWGFSDTYFQTSIAALVPEDSPIKSFADLKARKVGFQKGSLSEKFARQFGVDTSNSQSAKTSWLLWKSVVSNENEAIIDDAGPLKYYEKQYPNEKVRIITDDSLPKFDYGFAVRKNDTELLNKLNAGLAQIKLDGTYDRLYKQYFAK
ncbi:transporter substrate-binding domain-containing protein [Wielerella bovis]|uniref:transporter substrate-binding domain-containing protein n=1 Tax=Wielerella bovis TaxID=2917790 RepID=UPI002018D94C|nr:transporter substrate-binding domain-containing protein [Wielerella bovis]MCG7657972.1 transporter substrate-binding domain-containing protein [Wielerella bovis]MCG7660194.1 transporter substrate-binding domain-containing protein [Wielerella bovis]